MNKIMLGVFNTIVNGRMQYIPNDTILYKELEKVGKNDNDWVIRRIS